MVKNTESHVCPHWRTVKKKKRRKTENIDNDNFVDYGRDIY